MSESREKKQVFWSYKITREKTRTKENYLSEIVYTFNHQHHAVKITNSREMRIRWDWLKSLSLIPYTSQGVTTDHLTRYRTIYQLSLLRPNEALDHKVPLFKTWTRMIRQHYLELFNCEKTDGVKLQESSFCIFSIY